MAEKSKVIESLMPFWKKGIPVYTVQIEFLLFLSSIIIRKKIIMKNFDILFKCCVFLVLMHFSNNCLYASTDTISRRHKVTLREAHVGDLDVDTRLLDNYGLLPENIREFYYTSWDDHDYFNNDLAGIPKGLLLRTAMLSVRYGMRTGTIRKMMVCWAKADKPILWISAPKDVRSLLSS